MHFRPSRASFGPHPYSRSRGRARVVVFALMALCASALALAVEPTGPPAARPDPVARVSADVAGRAGTVARQMARDGRLSMPVSVESRPIARSTAAVDFDFASGRCVVSLDPKRFAVPALRSALGQRFVLLHELSHCEFFAQPGLFAAMTGGDAVAARMLDDLVLFDTIDPPEDRPALNLFALAHEAYADVRAIALLRASGVPAQRLAFIAALREAAPFERNHASADAVRAALALPEAALHGDALERSVREIVARFIVAHHLATIFASSDDLERTVREVLRSRRSSVIGRAQAGEPILTAPHLGNGDAHPDGLDRYGSLQWYYRRIDREQAPFTENEYAELWMAHSYGTGADAGDSLSTAARVLGRLLRGEAAARASSST